MKMNYFEFFDAIAANNNREWFAAHKDIYLDLRARWIATMQKAMMQIGEFWPEVRHLDMNRATYRIYRDIRFSPDKTPYKTHIGTLIEPGGGKLCRAGIYIQAASDPTDSGIYAGIWHPEMPKLRKIRKAIADNAEEFLSIAEDKALIDAYGTEWYGDRLVTAPQGYAKDHPMIEFLRMKDIGKYAVISREDILGDHWADIIVEHVRAALPLVEFLNYSIDEDL